MDSNNLSNPTIPQIYNSVSSCCSFYLMEKSMINFLFCLRVKVSPCRIVALLQNTYKNHYYSGFVCRIKAFA